MQKSKKITFDHLFKDISFGIGKHKRQVITAVNDSPILKNTSNKIMN